MFNDNLKEKINTFFKSYKKIIFIFLIIILALIIINLSFDAFKERNLEVKFLDVGQGDSVLITTPKRQKILIDGGPTDEVVRKLEKYFSPFEKNIDLLIMSHPDSDHIFGFNYVLQKYKVKNILENGDKFSESEVEKEMQEKIKKQVEKTSTKIWQASCGDKINLGEKKSSPTIYILHPVKNNLVKNDSNDNSIVVLLSYGEYSFLFSGDISEEVEKKIFFNLSLCFEKEEARKVENKLKNLTTYKVSHHGSKSGNGEFFLKLIKPEYSIISVGKDNPFNHPNREVVTILEKYSENIITTKESGDIIFKTNGKDLEIKLNK